MGTKRREPVVWIYSKRVSCSMRETLGIEREFLIRPITTLDIVPGLSYSESLRDNLGGPLMAFKSMLRKL